MSEDEAFEQYMSAVMRMPGASIKSFKPKSKTEKPKTSAPVEANNRTDLNLATKETLPDLSKAGATKPTVSKLVPPLAQAEEKTKSIENEGLQSKADLMTEKDIALGRLVTNLIKMPTAENLAPDCTPFISALVEQIVTNAIEQSERGKQKISDQETAVENLNTTKLENIDRAKPKPKPKAPPTKPSAEKQIADRRALFELTSKEKTKKPVKKVPKKVVQSKERQELFSTKREVPKQTMPDFNQTQNVIIQKTVDKEAQPSSPIKEDSVKQLADTKKEEKKKKRKNSSKKKKKTTDEAKSSKTGKQQKKPSFFKRLFGGGNKDPKTVIPDVPTKPPRPASVRQRKPSEQIIGNMDSKLLCHDIVLDIVDQSMISSDRLKRRQKVKKTVSFETENDSPEGVSVKEMANEKLPQTVNESIGTENVKGSSSERSIVTTKSVKVVDEQAAVTLHSTDKEVKSGSKVVEDFAMESTDIGLHTGDALSDVESDKDSLFDLSDVEDFDDRIKVTSKNQSESNQLDKQTFETITNLNESDQAEMKAVESTESKPVFLKQNEKPIKDIEVVETLVEKSNESDIDSVIDFNAIPSEVVNEITATEVQSGDSGKVSDSQDVPELPIASTTCETEQPVKKSPPKVTRRKPA